VARTVMLVFAIITLVFGAILMTGWFIILSIDIALKQTFPGTTMSPEDIISFYLLLTFGIVLIAVSILLFILRAKRKD
jgi:TRAP-type C4-dicarboxylate transport system permease small subunit